MLTHNIKIQKLLDGGEIEYHSNGEQLRPIAALMMTTHDPLTEMLPDLVIDETHTTQISENACRTSS